MGLEDLFIYGRVGRAAREAEAAHEGVVSLKQEIDELRAEITDLHKLVQAFLITQIRTGVMPEDQFRRALKDVAQASELAGVSANVTKCPKCGRNSPINRLTCMYCDAAIELSTD